MHTCIICGSNSSSRRTRNSQAYYKCPSCGLIWRGDSPRVSETEEYYTNLNPTDAISESKRRLYHNALAEAEKRIGNAGRVMDIGCGQGSFLAVARECGWDVFGVEPVKKLVDESRRSGHDVYHGTLEGLDSEQGKFDLITYWDVLMLVTDPAGEMNLARKFLSERGQIYLRIRQHQVLRLIERLWRIVGPLTGMKNPAVYHPYNFQPGTISVLFKRLGMNARIYNGRLTSGDTYGVSIKADTIASVKKTLDRLIEISTILSGGRWIISPTMDVWVGNG